MSVQFTYATYVAALNEGVSKNVHCLRSALAAAGEDVRMRSPRLDISEMNRKSVYARRGVEAYRLLKEGFDDPDVGLLHYHVSIPPMAVWGALARLARRRARKPLVVHFWNASFELADARGAGAPLEVLAHLAFNSRLAVRPWLASVDAAIVSSEHQRRQLLRSGMRAPIHVVPNGVDTDQYRPPQPGEREAARESLGIPDDGEVLVYYGHATPWKGVRHFVEALPQALAARPSARAVLALTSYGSVADRLRSRVRSLGLARRVTFLGTCHVPTLLKASDVGCVPMVASVGTACHPNVLLEYLSAGVAVAASRAGSIPEVVEDGRTGILVPPADPGALGAALARLLEDATLRERLARAARRDALVRFEWATAAKEIRRAWNDVLYQKP